MARPSIAHRNAARTLPAYLDGETEEKIRQNAVEFEYQLSDAEDAEEEALGALIKHQYDTALAAGVDPGKLNQLQQKTGFGSWPFHWSRILAVLNSVVSSQSLSIFLGSEDRSIVSSRIVFVKNLKKLMGRNFLEKAGSILVKVEVK